MSSTEIPLEGATEQPSPSTSSVTLPSTSGGPSIVEFKKDGTISRMRSHRGNMPSLPQTKHCPVCPAKFTRTTHLNRHMRTHSNERLHRCDTCSSQFTRSDLLTRHKKGCGDPTSQRTRRKSCQACAESKVKCDLQYPCTKCKNRGKECIYVGGPPVARISPTSARLPEEATIATSIMKDDSPAPCDATSITIRDSAYFVKSYSPSSFDEADVLTIPHNGVVTGSMTPASRKSSVTSIRSVSDAAPHGTLPLPSSRASPSLVNSYIVDPIVHSTTASPAQRTIPTPNASRFGSPMSPPLDFTDSSAASSPPSDVEPPADFNHLFSSELDALALQSQGNSMCSSNVFQPLFSDLFSGSSGMLVDDAMAVDALTWDGPRTGQERDPQFPFLTAPMDISTPFSNMSEHMAETRPAAAFTSSTKDPTPEELQHYLYLFFTAFLKQMPIMHGPTWKTEGKPAVLINAMHACGALYVKTRKAANFVTRTLDASRDILLQEFAREPNNTADQIHLILAVSLLQTIGLFHQKASQRATSNIYHGMLVMMIRRCNLISTIAAWTPPTMTDATSTDQAWREWGLHETAKRALLLSYMHDCCHALFFAIRPSFILSEMALNLPCEDTLWRANSSNEWSYVLLGPSPYGTSLEARLKGPSMLQVHTSMREYHMPSSLPALSTFAHIIVIHTILRDIYAIGIDNPSPADKNLGEKTPDHSVSQEIFSLQYWLHNWLQSWMNGPETPKMDEDEEPPFIVNVLPYYWLAQVSILAYQEGLPPFKAGRASHLNSEAHFRLVKHWLEHIRSFLRKGERAPTLFWDELMKVRLQTRHADRDGEGVVAENPDGLLGFFTEN